MKNKSLYLFLFRFNSNSLLRFSASSDLFLISCSKRFLIIFENKIYKNIWIFKSYSFDLWSASYLSLVFFRIFSLSAHFSNSLLRFSASSDLFLRSCSKRLLKKILIIRLINKFRD